MDKCDVPTLTSQRCCLVISFGEMLCSFEKRKVLKSTELDQPFHLREDNLSEAECLFQVTQQMSVLAGQSADPPLNPRLVLLTYSPCPSLGSRWEKFSVSGIQEEIKASRSNIPDTFLVICFPNK